MNYRHAYHAGNFADVLKHAILTRVLLHLKEKETPFRVIDTHAGAGRYDLGGEQAEKTGEWREGIGKLIEAPPSGSAGELLSPYLDLVRNENAGNPLRYYPGSPAIARALCRGQDQMIFCELHPKERTALHDNEGNDRRVKISDLDAWTALKAFLPPPERRGVVLIDPPFEQPDEFERMEAGLLQAHRRFATGVFLLWYPVKNFTEVDTFARNLKKTGIPKILRIELLLGKTAPDSALSGCGLIAVNPPWKLEAELREILPALRKSLQRDVAPAQRLEWLSGET